MIFCDGVSNGFQQHRFTCFWLGYNQPALAFEALKQFLVK